MIYDIYCRENHYGKDVLITRKGAVSAQKGQLGIIPGSMGATVRFSAQENWRVGIGFWKSNLEIQLGFWEIYCWILLIIDYTKKQQKFTNY